MHRKKKPQTLKTLHTHKLKTMRNIQQMIEVVKAYIFHMKGVEVEIRNPQSQVELLKLMDAYNTSIAFFNENGSIIFRQ